MTTTAATGATGQAVLDALSGSQTKATAKSEATGMSDRFLKLLVTQLQNQDPLNPMDNAQVTSQMAQISTVSGIQQLNTSISDLGSQFSQSQSLQAAGLVGHDVTIAGNQLDMNVSDSGAAIAVGGFSLQSPATNVQVTVKNSAGITVDSFSLSGVKAGMHQFTWDKGDATQNYSFSLQAVNGSTAVEAKPLMRDYVTAVSMSNNQLTLQTLKSGGINYSSVVAVN